MDIVDIGQFKIHHIQKVEGNSRAEVPGGERGPGPGRKRGSGPVRGDRPERVCEVFASAPTSDQAISSAKTVQTSWPGSACTATSKLPFFIVDKT